MLFSPRARISVLKEEHSISGRVSLASVHLRIFMADAGGIASRHCFMPRVFAAEDLAQVWFVCQASCSLLVLLDHEGF